MLTSKIVKMLLDDISEVCNSAHNMFIAIWVHFKRDMCQFCFFLEDTQENVNCDYHSAEVLKFKWKMENFTFHL